MFRGGFTFIAMDSPDETNQDEHHRRELPHHAVLFNDTFGTRADYSKGTMKQYCVGNIASLIFVVDSTDTILIIIDIVLINNPCLT